MYAFFLLLQNGVESLLVTDKSNAIVCRPKVGEMLGLRNNSLMSMSEMSYKLLNLMWPMKSRKYSIGVLGMMAVSDGQEEGDG